MTDYRAFTPRFDNNQLISEEEMRQAEQELVRAAGSLPDAIDLGGVPLHKDLILQGPTIGFRNR